MFQQKPPQTETKQEEEKTKSERMEVDQRTTEDTGLEKRLTQDEYQQEFARQVSAEAQVFAKTLNLIGQLPA